MYWNQQQHVRTDFVVGQCIYTMRVIGLSQNFTIYALVTSFFQDYFEYLTSKCRVRWYNYECLLDFTFTLNFAHSNKEYLFTNKHYEPIVYCNVMIIYNPVSNDDLVALLLVAGWGIERGMGNRFSQKYEADATPIIWCKPFFNSFVCCSVV